MSMVVMHNIPALSAYNTVNRTSSSLQKSIQKLSTGLRINSAADDAAGLAISEKMRAQIRGLDRAVSNSQDGISMIQTAEGALNETHSILQRMRELSVQSANDTLTQQDRGYIQLEIDQLREEITRIGNTTQFNKKKLLNGDAAVLWSSDSLNTKAIINGGLRQIDQFGQKRAAEGNYKLSISSEAGAAEVKKSDIFKVKHKDVINISQQDRTAIKDVSVKDLLAGEYKVNGDAGADIAAKRLFLTKGAAAASYADGLFKGELTGQANANKGSSYELLLEVLEQTKGAGVKAGTGPNDIKAEVKVKITALLTNAQGVTKEVTQTVTLAAKETGATGDAPTNDVDLTGELEGLSVDKDKLTAALLNGMAVGDKAIYQGGKKAATADLQLQVTDPSANIAAGELHRYNLKFSDVKGKTVVLQQYRLDEKTNTVSKGEVRLSIADKKPNPAGADKDPVDVVLDDLKKKPLVTFKTMAIGEVAKSGVRLRDLDKFWDAQGRFMLTDPQVITITQGDGKQAKVTLYANDTLGDVAKKFNDAIASKDGLGQGDYVNNSSYFTNFVDTKEVNTAESVEGTFVIRSVVPGANGKLSFAGDEDLVKAFSLNVIQEAKESNYTVDITDAHTGATVVSGVRVTGNKLIGVVHPNVDVEFDAMAGIKATWNSVGKKYDFDPSQSYSTILHLADNTTVFQIGANEGEDMGINIGDMRAHALGLNAVLVTDRESAARSITIIDNAIDKVSTQRAKLGAYQNRLEHTINNLNTAAENLTSAESRIRDTDMAKEMMNFTKLQIMLQAGTSMLAQANQLPQSVLTLIR